MRQERIIKPITPSTLGATIKTRGIKELKKIIID